MEQTFRLPTAARGLPAIPCGPAVEPDLSAQDLSALQHGLEVISAAMAILDAGRKLVFANNGARELFAERDGILIDPANEVRCQNRAAQKQLQAAVAAALAPVEPGGEPAGRPRDGHETGLFGFDRPRTFAVPRARGWPLCALISCAATRPGHAGSVPRLVLLLRDPGRELQVRPDYLCQLFALSRAEAAVVARLAAGLDLEEIAAERGVSLVTVRNQLKAALARLGISRQAELVSVVLRAVQF